TRPQPCRKVVEEAASSAHLRTTQYFHPRRMRGYQLSAALPGEPSLHPGFEHEPQLEFADRRQCGAIPAQPEDRCRRCLPWKQTAAQPQPAGKRLMRPDEFDTALNRPGQWKEFRIQPALPRDRERSA